MAIVQISRITNRTGLLTDLPQPLASAELGWAIDSRQLFIGNGELVDGAPAVGNTEILTEFTDLFALRKGYTYKGEAGTYTVQTGPTAQNPVAQSLQSRLDSFAVATDFGIVGDGNTDNTAAINRALYQLYCRDATTPNTRRALFFPAGRYVITGTLLVPTFATLYGEGTDGSIISFVTQVWSNLNAYTTGTTVVKDATYYIANVDVPAGTSLGDSDYWTVVDRPPYIFRTADSNQNVGTAIGSDVGIPPTGISISNMIFETDAEMDCVLMEDVDSSLFTNVTVRGPMAKTDISSEVPDIAAIRWAGTLAYPCVNNKFVGCNFSNITYGTATDQAISNNMFSQCVFDTLLRGIMLTGSATKNRIVDNTFDNIFWEGILFTDASRNVTGYNTFGDVGNEFNGVDYPLTANIDFNGENNVSIGDMFDRTNESIVNDGYPNITLNNKLNVAFDGATKLDLGSYQRQSGLIATLVDAQSDLVLFTVDATQVKAFNIDYTVVRGAAVKTARFTVVASVDGNGPTLAYDEFCAVENTDTGVTFSASESLNIISVLYTTSAIAQSAQLSYSVTKLA